MCLSYPSMLKNDSECLNIKSENKQSEQYNQSEPQSEHRTAKRTAKRTSNRKANIEPQSPTTTPRYQCDE